MELPKFPRPEDVNLTLMQLAGLSTIVMGEGQARSQDKPKAIAKLWGALVKRYGPKAEHIYTSVITAPSAEDGLNRLKNWMVGLEKASGKPTARLEATTINGLGSENTPAAKLENKRMDDQTNTTGEASDVLTPEQQAAADAAIAAGTTAPVAPAVKKVRANAFAGKKLTCIFTKEEGEGEAKKAVVANPRKPGSHGHKSIQVIIDHPGITTEEYLKTGGRLNDLKWDIDHKFVQAV